MSEAIRSEFGADMRLVQEDELEAVSGGILPLIGGLIMLFELGMIGGAIAADYKYGGSFLYAPSFRPPV
jgi:hypothetical protein